MKFDENLEIQLTVRSNHWLYNLMQLIYMPLSWLQKDKLERNEVYKSKLLVGIFNLALLVYHINSYNSLLEN